MLSSADPSRTVHRLLDPHTPFESVISEAELLTKRFFSPLQTRYRYWRMRLYAPVYLSSYCVNQCLYCGFRAPGEISRKHLTVQQTKLEAMELMRRGFKNLLLVAGESPRVSPDYLSEMIRELTALGAEVSVEVAPQSVETYTQIIAAGCRGITLFQETFHKELYKKYHPEGPKADFDWRYHAISRAAQAGMSRLGFGFLVGLADPKEDLIAMVNQAAELHDKFHDRRLAFSLPRLHAAPKGFTLPFPVDDDFFIRMYCVLRTLFPQAELVLSTREKPELRNRLASICITQMSAGSSTAPGGYVLEKEKKIASQFEITDERPLGEIQNWLAENGHEVVF